MYSAFFSSAISSWFIRTSRRARTWAMDRGVDVKVTHTNGATELAAALQRPLVTDDGKDPLTRELHLGEDLRTSWRSPRCRYILAMRWSVLAIDISMLSIKVRKNGYSW